MGWLGVSIRGRWESGRARCGGNANSASDGAVLLILNPKAYLIIALMFTQFPCSQLRTLARPSLILWIATVFTLNNLVAFTVWTIAGDLLEPRAVSGAALVPRPLTNRVRGAAPGCPLVWILVR